MLDKQNGLADNDRTARAVQQWRTRVPAVTTADSTASKSFHGETYYATHRDQPIEDTIHQIPDGQKHQQAVDQIHQLYTCQDYPLDGQIELPTSLIEEGGKIYNSCIGSPFSVQSSSDSDLPTLILEESESFLSDADESSRSFPELQRKVSFSETIEVYIVPSRRKNGQPRKRINLPAKKTPQNQPVVQEFMFSMRVWDLEDSDVSVEGFEQYPPTSCVP